MTIEVQQVGALRVWKETTFATDGTGTLGNYTYVPFREGTAQMTLTIDEIDPQQAVQFRDEGREFVLGKRSATLAFTLNLAPTGTAANSTTTAVEGALGYILNTVLGGRNTLASGTTAGTGSTATAIVCTNTAGAAKFAAGGVVGWVNSSSALEVREIESIATRTLTLKHAFSGSPSLSAQLYNGVTYYPTQDPSDSLQFIVEDTESDDRWLLLGGQCVGGITCNFDVTGAQLPSITFNFTFADWKTGAETGNLSGTLGTATYSNYSPIVGHAGEFRVFTVGTSTLSTATRIPISAFTWAPKVAYTAVTSPSGTNTVYRWRGARTMPPVEGSFTTFYSDLTWFTARSSKTDHHIQYQMGQTAGSTIVVTAPTVQILNPQRAASGEQIAGQTVMYKGRRDTDVDSSTGAQAKAPFRIHIC